MSRAAAYKIVAFHGFSDLCRLFGRIVIFFKSNNTYFKLDFVKGVNGYTMETIQSEIKKQLMQQYKYRIEMHAHTAPVSPCSQVTPEEMAQTYAQLGYDAVVITNHFIYELLNDLPKEEAVERYMKGYEDTRRAAEQYGLHVLLGAEIRFTENINDYLIYGADSDLLKTVYDYLPQGIEALRKTNLLENSVFIQAHPFRDGMERVDPSLLDGIEVFNVHPGHNSRIAMAARYAAENGMSLTTAGTDFHHPGRGHEGLSAVRTKTLPENSYALAQILRSGDYIMEIGTSAIVLP